MFILHVRVITALAAATLVATLASPVAAQVVMTPGQLTLPPARPTFTLSVAVSTEVASGEEFQFSTIGGSTVVVTAKGEPVAFAAPIGAGAPYVIVQTGGPRSCSQSDNRRGIITANVVVTLSCGRSPGATKVAGELRALVGSRVVLQLNGTGDLPLTVPPVAGSTDRYNILPFAFVASVKDGTPYRVTIKTQPAGQQCSVYAGESGTAPVRLGALLVGCDIRADHLSRTTDNATRGTFYESSAPVVGGSNLPSGRTQTAYGEGRFVAFGSSAARLGGSTGKHRQIFWRDRLTGETRLVSRSAAGVEGDGDSFAASISADGLSVAFESYATNLVASDLNRVRDVFLWKADSPETPVQRISLGAGGVEADAESWEASLSGDGSVVAFTSVASNITAGIPGKNTENVFRCDLASGAATLVSKGSKGKGVGGSRPSISEDGNRIAFHSTASDLVTGDRNNLWDIFVYEHSTNRLMRVSKTSTGGERDQGSESASRTVAPALSGDGKFVAYTTTANNVVGTQSKGFQNVYLVNIESGEVRSMSLAAGDVAADGDSPIAQGERPAISYDGRFVAFPTSATNLGVPKRDVLIRDVTTGQVTAVAGPTVTNLSVGTPAMSRTGAFIVLGASQQLDKRYPSSGLFAVFTGLAPSWWWVK